MDDGACASVVPYTCSAMSRASMVDSPAVLRHQSQSREETERSGTRAWTRADVGIMVLAAVLAVIPRTVNLLGLDPFVDEASSLDWTLRLIDLTAPRTWLLSMLMDGRPPLYFWLLMPFSAVVDNGFLAGRLLTALADVLCVLALYVLGRELASRTVGALAAILWALSPLPIFFARLAVDDSLLTLMAVLTTLTAVRLARQPTVASGAWFGLTLGVTVLVKTNGALIGVALPLALVMLGRPSEWRTYVRPLGAACLAGLLPIPLLLLGVGPVLHQIVDHTRGADPGGGSLLARNAVTVAGWLETYVGNRFLLVAGAGVVLALVFRQTGLLFAALLGFSVMLVIVAISSPIFARRLLLPAFPAFLLAAYAIERVGYLVAWAVRAVGPGRERAWLAVCAAVIAVGLVVALGERADLAVTIVRSPAEAKIPGSEHLQYFENWYALYGLGQIAEELRAQGRERPVTVLVPPASRENRVIVPYAALRYYLRRDPAVRFVEAPALWRAQDLRELRQLTRDGPTYLVVNGSYTLASGMPNDAPAYTRQLERRLAQDFPNAREVLRIPRPIEPNWLSLYRLDE
jgi:hypothetical protein